MEFLSSTPLGGRLTGTVGEQLATEYVANVFRALGLEPAGDNGTFFQSFDFMAGVSLGPRNSLTLTDQQGVTKHLELNRDWRPLSCSDNIRFKSTELVFAGYGIRAPALGQHKAYDSYQGLNVKDKWVVVFRFMPEQIDDEQRRHLNQYTSPRYKVFTAHDHGAKGIIFISGPNSKIQNELIPLSSDTSMPGSGIVVLSVKDKVIDELLKNTTHSVHPLQTMQSKLDKGEQLRLNTLTGITLFGEIDIKRHRKYGRNVLAKLKTNTTQSKMMIVGAHVDHLGHGELNGSRSGEHEKGLIHSGADDNASGVASVLEAAGRLTELKTQGKLHGNNDILFAIWSGEELGLLGSTYFVNDFLAKNGLQSLRPSIQANINLDMVGRFREAMALQGTGSSTMWPKLIKQANTKRKLHLILQPDPYLPTDSTSFYLHGVPSINFFTGSHDEYHTARDTPKTLNYQGMTQITQLLVDLILTLERQTKPISFQEVSKKNNTHGRGFRIYLGTFPDYTSTQISGVKLEGVTKESPAAKAGLKPQDIIIHLAGKKIHDIYDYTFVLSALRIGIPVSLEVLRKQKKIVLTVVPRYRD